MPLAEDRSNLLILLSSSARPRYRDDIVRTLALPMGGEVQFRYEVGIVDEAVIKTVKDASHERQVLVCYIQTGNEGGSTVIVPCRFASLTRAAIVGSTLVLTLAVNAFAKDLDDGVFRKKLVGVDGALVPHWRHDGSQYRLLGKFVLSTKATFAEHRSRDLAAFEGVARVLGRCPEFGLEEGAVFYSTTAILEVRERSLTGPDTGTEQLESFKIERGAYRLRSGRRYLIEVYCLAQDRGPRPVGNNMVRLGATSGSAMILFSGRAVEEIDSDYDVKRFEFETEPRVDARSALIRLDLMRDGKPATWGGIGLPVVFSGSLSFAVFRVAMIACGTSAPAMLVSAAKAELSPTLAFLMLAAGTVAGVASVFPSLKR